MPESIALTRAFIAITPDPLTAQSLITACEPLQKNAGQKVRWIAQQNLHVTLKFLGDLNTEEIATLPGLLEDKLRGYEPFTLEFNNISWFPSIRRPRIMAACFKTSPALHALALRSEMAARAIGLPSEIRPFRAHLTLARVHDKLLRLPEIDIPLNDLRMSVSRITLYSSVLEATGPTYREIYSLPLGA